MRLRKRLLSGAAVVLAVTTGCTSDPGTENVWVPPTRGQAAVLLDRTTAGTGNGLGFDGMKGINGLAIGTDGSIYSLDDYGLVEVRQDRSVDAVLTDVEGAVRGLVVLADGSLLFGEVNSGRPVIRKLAADRSASVLAGGQARLDDREPPASATATDFPFAMTYPPFPLGTRPDGSVLIVDDGTLWALHDGQLDKVYQAESGLRLGHGLGGVDGKGTAYVLPSTDVESGTVGNIVTVDATGAADRIHLPGKVAGLPENPASLNVAWLAADDADGVYVHAFGDSGSYVLHLRSGKADLVAAHHRSGAEDDCAVTGPVDALDFPCELPFALAYRAGRLIMTGGRDYALDIRP